MISYPITVLSFFMPKYKFTTFMFVQDCSNSNNSFFKLNCAFLKFNQFCLLAKLIPLFSHKEEFVNYEFEKKGRVSGSASIQTKAITP